jgi:TusE/DsrC/DsvC family sulfur relay protein
LVKRNLTDLVGFHFTNPAYQLPKIPGEAPVPEILYNGLKITVDDNGFLIDLEDWSEAVARVLAAQEGITELAEDQLDILKFMREYYRKHKFFPIVRYVCKNVHQPRNCVTEKFMDPVTAWKIAGLPNPGEEVINFKAWEPLGF